MKFSSPIINVLLCIAFVVGLIYSGRRDMELMMEPHVGKDRLGAMVQSVAGELGGTISKKPDVAEKYNYIHVSAFVNSIPDLTRLGDIVHRLEDQGFVTRTFLESKAATLCQRETVIRIELFPSAESGANRALVTATWGTGRVVCRNQEAMRGGSSS